MLTSEDLIAEAAAMPLADAAFALWIKRDMLNRLEGIDLVDVRHPKFAGMPARDAMAEVTKARDAAEAQLIFDRLKRAHPRATDAAARRAIASAQQFNDALFRCFTWRAGEEFIVCVQRAVSAARKRHPGYQETTYRDAENHVAYSMK
jgi:hypothetical protein